MDKQIKEAFKEIISKNLEIAMILIQKEFSDSIQDHNEIKIIDVKIGNLKTRCTFFTEEIKE